LSPLSANFDKNIIINQVMGCLAIFNANLKPGENTTILGPGSNNSYLANSTGTTNTNVTFSYTDENKSENTISKSFAFDILANTPIPEFPLISLVIFTISILVSIVLVSRNHNIFKL
jgi:predicted secreted protein with PEFG-CTERM motif